MPHYPRSKQWRDGRFHNPPEWPQRLGLSAVLRLKDGNLDYWAMQHSGVQADFHNSIDWLGQFKLMP